MKKNILYSLLSFFFVNTQAQLVEKRVRILFAGDVMQHMPQVQAAYNKIDKIHCYDSCFAKVKPYFAKVDLVIANLETTLSGVPYSGYPCFSAPDAIAQDLQKAGVNVLVTANNHCCDHDLKGVTRTIQMLDSFKIPHTGTFISKKDKNEKEPLIIEKNGLRLALLSYTYSTNGRSIPKTTAINVIDTNLMAKDIEKSKALTPDEIIVFIHWGNEYQRTESPAQRKIQQFLNRQGVRIIIGSHPHVIEPMEATIDANKKITQITVFSLGNFVSNQRKQYTDGGCMFYLEISKDEQSVNIENPGYMLTWVLLRSGAGLSTYQILPVAEFETQPDFFRPAELEKFNIFKENSRTLLDSLNLNISEKKDFKEKIEFSLDKFGWIFSKPKKIQ